MIVLCLGFVPLGHAQQNDVRISIPSSAVLPNDQSIHYMTVVKPIDKSLIYSTTGWVIYTQIILKSGDGREQIIYQTPSSPYADVTPYLKPRKEIPIVVRTSAEGMEIMSQSHGWFHLLRFRQVNGKWTPVGMMNESDFDDTARSGEVVCLGAELIGRGKIQLNMSNGGKRILSIDEEGVIRENGKVHEYTRVQRLGDEPQEQFYKNKYKQSLAEYFEPRDANGVPISYIEFINKKKAKLRPTTPPP